MKVFMRKRRGGYSGGLAVVAANSKEEAFKTFFENKDYDWMVDKYDVDTYEFADNCTKWGSLYYQMELWFKRKGANCKCK